MESIRVLGCLAAACVAATTCADERLVWFGTYTGPQTGSEGIYVARFDDATGAVSAPELAAQARSPSFLAVHPTLPMVYAVSEVVNADGSRVGGVQAFAIDPGTGRLTARNHQPSGGAGPCHVSVDTDGRVALAANYAGGSAICLALGADGDLAPVAAGEPGGFLQHAYDRKAGTGFDPRRQAKAHGHSIDPTPDGRFAIVCDLGLDKVFVHALDRERATLAPHGFVATKAGAGPRHFALHPGGRFGYGVNELDLTVTAFAFDPQAGSLAPLQTLSMLPDDVSERSGFKAAEIAVHPTGRFVYASNRGHDSIAMYAVDDATGKLRFLGAEPTRAKTPRGFGIDPTGRFLLACGQASGTVTVFAIDAESGRLTFTGTTLAVPAPVCVVFARQPQPSTSSR